MEFLADLFLSNQWLQFSLVVSSKALFPQKSLYKDQVLDFSAFFGGPQCHPQPQHKLCPRKTAACLGLRALFGIVLGS